MSAERPASAGSTAAPVDAVRPGGHADPAGTVGPLDAAGPGSPVAPASPGGRPPLDVLIRRLDPEVPLPSYAQPGDAGADLRTTEACQLEPGERAVLPTGVSVALPEGYAAFVHPRSGLAARCGVALVNAPGTVDAGYRGEIKVIVVNLDPREAVRFERFDRIAQLVVQQVERVRFQEVAELPGSARAEGGFGSTGGHAAVDGTSGTSGQAAMGGRAGGNRYASVVSDREGQ